MLFHSSEDISYRCWTRECPVHRDNLRDIEHACLRAVILPLPYDPVDTVPYTSSTGEFLHEPFFHDDSEVTTQHAISLLFTAPFPSLPLSFSMPSQLPKCNSQTQIIRAPSLTHWLVPDPPSPPNDYGCDNRREGSLERASKRVKNSACEVGVAHPPAPMLRSVTSEPIHVSSGCASNTSMINRQFSSDSALDFLCD